MRWDNINFHVPAKKEEIEFNKKIYKDDKNKKNEIRYNINTKKYMK